MNFLTTKLRLFDYEGLPPSLSESDWISINLTIPTDAFEVTHTRPCLFDCASFSHHCTYMPEIEVEHDDTWGDIGRAYYESREYQFSEFHCTLCSVDEMKQQIEAWVRQYEQNRILSAPYFVMVESVSDFFERCLSQRHWNDDFHAWIEDFQTRNSITRNAWMADDHHSCHPFEDKIFYLHQLAKQILSGYSPHVSAAKRPRCRSLLMATCHQLSGDDLLGH